MRQAIKLFFLIILAFLERMTLLVRLVAVLSPMIFHFFQIRTTPHVSEDLFIVFFKMMLAPTLSMVFLMFLFQDALLRWRDREISRYAHWTESDFQRQREMDAESERIRQRRDDMNPLKMGSPAWHIQQMMDGE